VGPLVVSRLKSAPNGSECRVLCAVSGRAERGVGGWRRQVMSQLRVHFWLEILLYPDVEYILTYKVLP